MSSCRILVAVMALLLGPPSLLSAQDADKNAVEACSQFAKGANRITEGMAESIYAMELEMRSVYLKAEQSKDAVLRQKAGAIVRGLQIANQRAGSADPAKAAIQDFGLYCRNVVLRGSSTIIFQPATTPPAPIPPPNDPALLKPGRTITPAEAEAQSKRAVEKAGKPGAKCETKVYGGGAAVTVCE